ncbi:MAG: cysteine desulfurase [Nocardioidaceae bacterium]|nr:cysteine desulfurase [Nocardioidaceae bacterium]
MAYLDHAATTPIYPEVVDAMAAQLARLGNASSLHGSGRAARRVVEESREAIAAALGAGPSEVVFTSGGTEADNLAVKGFYWSRRQADARRTRILTSAVEHHAVLDPLHWLATHEAAEVELLAVDADGGVQIDALRTSIERDPESVALVSVMWANNEVGTLQPIDEVVALAGAYGIPVHTDAVQALGQVPVDFAGANVDAMTVTGHKIGGPFGVGALLLRREADLVALLHGGGQERDVRSGTLDAPAIVGFARATELAVKSQPSRGVELGELRDALIAGVLDAVPDAQLNGAAGNGRLPGNAHFTFTGCEGDSLLMLLDAQGIECSTGSACSAGVPQASHVLLAMGRDEATARASLRFSLGHTSTASDVERLVEAIAPAVQRARAASQGAGGSASSNGSNVGLPVGGAA